MGVVARMGEQNLPQALACCRGLLSSLESDLKVQKQGEKNENTDNFEQIPEFFEKIPQKNGKKGKKINRKRRSN